MQQRIDLCKQKLSVKLLFSVAGGEYVTLNVFGSNVSDIAQRKDVTAESLLSASPFDLMYENNVLTSVKRV